MEATALILELSKSETQKSQITEILNAYQKLNYHDLNDLLDDEGYYQDMRKTSFILYQKRIFDSLRKKGDTKMSLSTNICTGCLCGAPLFVLIGNHSGFKYALYFEFTNDIVTDIYMCSQQSDLLDWMMPF